MRHFKRKKIVLCILAALVMVAAFGAVMMLTWNWLVPDLFNGPHINFWQALGLFLLFKLLFGGFSPRGRGHCGPGWKKDWRSKMADMTPEEREKLKQKFACKWHQNDPSVPHGEEKSGVK